MLINTPGKSQKCCKQSKFFTDGVLHLFSAKRGNLAEQTSTSWDVLECQKPMELCSALQPALWCHNRRSNPASLSKYTF